MRICLPLLQRYFIIVPQKNAYEIAQRVGILLDSLTADEIANQLLYV
jgi:hypothetical protein